MIFDFCCASVKEMRFFIVFLLFLSACEWPSDPQAQDDVIPSTAVFEEAAASDDSPAGDEESPEEENAEDERSFNQLKMEENYLRKKRREKGGDFHFVNYMVSDPICRRFSGCLKFCTWWNQGVQCHQWPVSSVKALWLSYLDNMSAAELINAAEWIAPMMEATLNEMT